MLQFPKEGCQCKSGTVRHYSGHCIAYEDCEKHNNEVSDKSNIDKPFVRRTRCNGGPFDEYGRIISREPTCGDSTTVVIFLQNVSIINILRNQVSTKKFNGKLIIFFTGVTD